MNCPKCSRPMDEVFTAIGGSWACLDHGVFSIEPNPRPSIRGPARFTTREISDDRGRRLQILDRGVAFPAEVWPAAGEGTDPEVSWELCVSVTEGVVAKLNRLHARS